MRERDRSGPWTVVVVHPDRAVRTRLVDTIADADTAPALEAVASLEEAAARDERPDAIVTVVPAGVQQASVANDGDGRSALPEALRSVPRVIVLDRPDAWGLSAAMALRPAGVVMPDTNPDLIRHAVVMAVDGAGVVLDAALVPIVADILADNIAAGYGVGEEPT